jgi:hypothetical protein
MAPAIRTFPQGRRQSSFTFFLNTGDDCISAFGDTAAEKERRQNQVPRIHLCFHVPKVYEKPVFSKRMK